MSSEGIITSLLSHTLLCDSSLFFCSKRMKKIQTIIFFDVIPLTNADSFLMQDNVNVILCDLRTKLGVFLRLKSLKNNAFFTIWVMFSNINRIYFFFFSIQNIKRNCSIILSNIPRSSFSGGKLIPSQLIYLWNV